MNVTYEIVKCDKVSDAETVVTVQIRVEPRTNGMDETVIQFPVKTKTMEREVKDRVKWKVEALVGQAASGIEPVKVEAGKGAA